MLHLRADYCRMSRNKLLPCNYSFEFKNIGVAERMSDLFESTFGLHTEPLGRNKAHHPSQCVFKFAHHVKKILGDGGFGPATCWWHLEVKLETGTPTP